MGVWDTPMYEIDDEAVDRAGERGARLSGQIRDRRAYRRAGQNFNLDSASDVLAERPGPAPVDESARIRAVASDRARRGDFAGRAELVNQLNVETNQGLNQARARTQNATAAGPLITGILRGTQQRPNETPEAWAARRRAGIEANRQRLIDAGYTPEQIEGATVGLTGPDAAAWESEILGALGQLSEAKVSEQTGDIFTIDPVTQAPQVTGQAPGADLVRRRTEADVATQERAARAPYPTGGSGGVQYRPVTPEEATAYNLPNQGRGYVMGSNGRPMAATSGGGVFPADQRARVAITFEPALEAVRTLDSMENLDRPEESRAQSYRLGGDWGAAAIDALDFGTGILDAPARMIGGIDVNEPDRGDYGRYRSAASAFEASILPILSGAAVSESEARRTVRAALPQVGDSDQVLRDKARRRRQMVNGAALIGGRPPPFPQDGVPNWATPRNSAPTPPSSGDDLGYALPQGVTAEEWAHMTPEERALWAQ